MTAANHALELYQQLAGWYEKQGQAQMRDRFWVLAADAALTAKDPEAAERFRMRLLQQNPHHLLKPYASFAEAMKVPDVQTYVADLRRSYPPEMAEHLLESARAEGEPAPLTAEPDLPGLEPLPEEPEVLQFYRVHGDLEEIPEPVKQRQAPVAGPVVPPSAAPAPIPLAPEPPARKPPTSPSPAPRPPTLKPPRSPGVSPYAVQPPAPSRARPSARQREEEDAAAGRWVSSALFVLVLGAGLVLAAYALVRPFLPAEWMR